MAGGDESAATRSAEEDATAEAAKDDAAHKLDNSQMSWVYSLVTQALANLIVDINGLTIRAEMLRSVRVDASAVATRGHTGSAAGEPLRVPRQAERRRRCLLTLNGQQVEATPAGFGPTVEPVAAAQTITGLVVVADPPLADGPLRNADALRGQISVVERGSVSFVEKARRLQAAGAAAVVVLNVDEADYVPLGMVGDPGSDIAVPVVCVRRSSAELLKRLTALGQSCRATLMLDAMATRSGQHQTDKTPAGGVGGTPAQRRLPSVSPPVTVQAVLLDIAHQTIPDGIPTVTVHTRDIDCSSATTAAAFVGDVAPVMPPNSPAASVSPIHSLAARNAAGVGTAEQMHAIDATDTPTVQYVVEPAWTVVLVFDVVRSHSTDATWCDVQIDAATGDPVDSNTNPRGNVQAATSSTNAAKNPSGSAKVDLSSAAQSSVSNADGAHSHTTSALHRVVDFSNLVMYVCEKSILDGLDFTLRIKLRTDAMQSLRHIDVTIPKVSLGLSQVQAQVLRCWYDWFMGTASDGSTAAPQSSQNPLNTPVNTPEKGKPKRSDVSATPARDSADSGHTGTKQEGSSWLGWAWGMVAGPEDGESSSGAGSDESPRGSPRVQADSSGDKSLGGATGEEELIETVKSNYKASAAVFLMYVIELDLVLRHEHTRYWHNHQFRTATGSVQARNAAFTDCGGQQQDGCFARFRFRELLIDQSKSQGQPVDVVVSSTFADVFALATTVAGGDCAGGSNTRSHGGTGSYTVPVGVMAETGVPVIICGQGSGFSAESPTGEPGVGPAASGATAATPAASVYGSLSDSAWDEVAAEQDSLSELELPRPVPPPTPPRSRHRSAALCVKIRGADPAVRGSSAQVETHIGQVSYFNAAEFNEDISMFCSEMFLAEDEIEAPKEAKELDKLRNRDASASNARKLSTPHAGLGPDVGSAFTEGGSTSIVSGLTGDQLVAAAVELARRMRNSRDDGITSETSAHRLETGVNSMRVADDVLASTALGHAAVGMLTEVEKRALDWTTSELAEVREERDRLKAELQEVRARLQRLEGPGT